MSDEFEIPNEETEGAELEPYQSGSESARNKADDFTDTLRVEEQLSMFWKGVKSCCDNDRIKRESADQFRAWIDKQIARNPGRPVGQYGHSGGRVKCRQHDPGPFGGERSCTASISVRAFVEFH